MSRNNILRQFETEQFTEALNNDNLDHYNDTYEIMMFDKARDVSVEDILEYILIDMRQVQFDEDFHGNLLKIALKKLR